MVYELGNFSLDDVIILWRVGVLRGGWMFLATILSLLSCLFVVVVNPGNVGHHVSHHILHHHVFYTVTLWIREGKVYIVWNLTYREEILVCRNCITWPCVLLARERQRKLRLSPSLERENGVLGRMGERGKGSLLAALPNDLLQTPIFCRESRVGWDGLCKRPGMTGLVCCDRSTLGKGFVMYIIGVLESMR